MPSNTQPSLRVRLAACAVFAAAPAVIALGTAASSYADTGDGSGSSAATRTHHEAFRGQNPQTDRPWYQTPNHDDKPESTNPFETPFGQFVLGNLGLGNLGPLGNLGLGNLGGLGGFR